MITKFARWVTESDKRQQLFAAAGVALVYFLAWALLASKNHHDASDPNEERAITDSVQTVMEAFYVDLVSYNPEGKMAATDFFVVVTGSVFALFMWEALTRSHLDVVRALFVVLVNCAAGLIVPSVQRGSLVRTSWVSLLSWDSSIYTTTSITLTYMAFRKAGSMQKTPVVYMFSRVCFNLLLVYLLAIRQTCVIGIGWSLMLVYPADAAAVWAANVKAKVDEQRAKEAARFSAEIEQYEDHEEDNQ